MGGTGVDSSQRSGSTPPGLVIFDNDGVLVDSEPLANAVLAELLTEAGVPTTAEESIERYVGSSLARVRAIMLAEHAVDLDGSFEDRYHADLFERFHAELRPTPGARDLLDALRAARVAVCVASSGSPERIRLALELTGLLDAFDGHLFSAQQVGRGKPAPDLFLYAAAQMGADPSRCVVIEDSALGIEAALAAEMDVWALDPTGSSPIAAAASAGRARRLDELIVPLLGGTTGANA